MTAEHVSVDALDAEDQRTPEWESMREQERRTGTLPKGTYDATLREVRIVKRKDGGAWVIRMLALTDRLGRYATAWQGLSENPEDPFDLTEGQVLSLRKFANKIGITTPASAQQIFQALGELLDKPVTVRVRQTPVGQQAVLMREAPAVVAPSLNGDSEAVTRTAWIAHEKLIEGLSAVRLGLACAAEGCHELHAADGWRALGYETLAEYLASPEITLSRTDFYDLVHIWESYVVVGGVQPAGLQGAGPSKLAVPLPALEQGVVSAEQAVADATSMTRKDLRAHYAAMLGSDAQEPAETTQERKSATVPVSVGRTLTTALAHAARAFPDAFIDTDVYTEVQDALRIAHEHGLDVEETAP